jgi:hypothetical protein
MRRQFVKIIFFPVFKPCPFHIKIYFSLVTYRKSSNHYANRNLYLPIFQSMLFYGNLLKDGIQPVGRSHLVVQATS